MAKPATEGMQITPPPVLLSGGSGPVDSKRLEKLVDSMTVRKEADMTKFAVLQDLMDRIVSDVQECRDSLYKSVDSEGATGTNDRMRKCCVESKHPQGTCWRHCNEVMTTHAKVMRDMLQERMESHIDCIQGMEVLGDRMRESLVQLARASWFAVEQEFCGWIKSHEPPAATIATPPITPSRSVAT